EYEQRLIGHDPSRIPPTMWLFTIVNLGLSCGYGLFLALAQPTSFDIPNQIGPLVLIGICLWAAYQIVRSSKTAAWSPIPWFLLACAVYFGVGPLVYYFGNDASIEFVNSFFPVDPESLLRSHLLNSIAMTIISGTTIIVESFLPK